MAKVKLDLNKSVPPPSTGGGLSGLFNKKETTTKEVKKEEAATKKATFGFTVENLQVIENLRVKRIGEGISKYSRKDAINEIIESFKNSK